MSQTNNVVGPIPINYWVSLRDLSEQIRFMNDRGGFDPEVINRDKEVFKIILSQFKKETN